MLYYGGRIVGISVNVEGFVVELSIWIIGSVKFRVMSRKLQIFRFALIEMFSPSTL